MKKIYGLLGFVGFGLLIGAVGGADTASFGVSVLLMCAGLLMMVMSELLVATYNRRRKARKLIKRKQNTMLGTLPEKKLVYGASAHQHPCKRIKCMEPELC